MIKPLKKHLFVCTNMRPGGGTSCGEKYYQIAKESFNEIYPVSERYKYRISSSGCMGRCPSGPVAVLYPDGKWLKIENEDHIKAIVADLSKIDSI